MLEIKGSQFIIRPWKKEDAKSIYENINHKKILRSLQEVFNNFPTKEEVQKYVNERLTGKKQKTSFVIVCDKKAVGAIGFRMKKENSAELGYWVGKKYWGRGIITEAIKLITDYAFKQFNLKKLYAKVYLDNPASIRVLEKAEYNLEGKSLKQLIYSRFPNSPTY